MKHPRRSFSQAAALAAVVSFGLFLVAFDILKGVDWSLPDVLQKILSGVSDVMRPRRGDEVRNFVLFTEVMHGRRIVVTGIEYGSSRNRHIQSQWCYLSDHSSSGNVVPRLSLAEVSGEGVKSIPAFTPSALSQFDLTDESARALIASHCRFQ